MDTNLMDATSAPQRAAEQDTQNGFIERSSGAPGALLENMWYLVCPGAQVPVSEMRRFKVMGQPVLLARNYHNTVFALRDICPHRGIPLSYGHFDGREVECPYHGWRFDGSGTCTEIPSLCSGQNLDPSRIKAGSYPVQEVQGNIWVFFGNKTENLPPVPTVPDIGDKYQLHISQVFKCNVDHAVIGLMDPAHGPYVHKSPLWRSKRTSYEKEKAFSPIEMGWKMDRHAASKNSKAYRIFLGGMPETEISFQLPTVRIEHAKTPKYTYCGLTVCTPIDAETTEVHHCMYWDVPWLSRVKPLLKLISHQFLGQDRRAVEQQKEGLAYDPNLMLINDADMMAKWYFRLKKEYAASQAEQRAFKNPVKPAVLRWRS